MVLTQPLASMVGIPEPSLRLLLGLLASYPLAYIQRQLVFHWGASSPTSRALVDLMLGLMLGYYFCGHHLIYPVLSVFSTYLLCRIVEWFKWNRMYAAGFAFFGNLAFLLLAYVTFASENYDINWTTPQSVLCLRMISIAMDFGDGEGGSEIHTDAPTNEISNGHSVHVKKNKESLPIWSQDLGLKQLPNVITFFAYAFFPSTFLVGPQFPFRLYEQYLCMDLYHGDNLPKLFQKAKQHSLYCLSVGLLYLGITHLVGVYFSTSFLVTPTFLTYPFWWRLMYSWVAGKAVLSKYLGVWLLSEGSSSLNGIAYHPRHGKFDALANVYVHAYETATSLYQVIGSFNINTNHWAKLYIFKRCKRFNSKHLSSFITLLFLALWHGFHPAYFFVFFLEFVDLQAELVLKHACPQWLREKTIFHSILCWSCATATLYYAAILFDLLTWDKIVLALNGLYWWGHLLVALILSFGMAFPRSCTTKHSHRENEKGHKLKEH